ncbi:Putative UDP-rhamnose:rhamnosyltransferase 1 [Apostasia shenzhenica]|uniref:UDP-rhamnose:rhamnosyltransferase 1 n=1 Tax=Apostasia shenzhenica TaxID=1088818 RepID=A0A2I0BG86_9ASPA|nr:Putative UDP-rhamnose:rhamnosyltransferase 1 [Apostasia shenzhenica]
MATERLHILMIPWPAFGHLLPFLELSLSLAKMGHLISFVTSPRNIQRLPTVPQSLSRLIIFVETPLPRTDHLPAHAEATVDLPSDDHRPYLRKAFDTFAGKLPNLIKQYSRQSIPLDFIIYDYAAYWVPPIAGRFGLPSAFFCLFNAAAMSFFGRPSALMGGEGARKSAEDFTVLPDWIPFPSTIAYRPHEARELFKPGVLPDASGVSEAYRFGKSIQESKFVAIRSCREFESEWLELIGHLYNKPIVPVGFLPPRRNDQESSHEARGWFDKQEKRSVVYVAFGSEVKLTAAQVEEIAMGLEQSKLPFLWALRAESAPPGFVDRVESHGRGRVCLGWVPQLEFLAHGSVGGFLTHGGWNSIVEGLSFGLAMVVLPMVFDQGLNARYLVDKGIAVEVPREETDGAFTGDGIARSLRLAMVKEEGEVYRGRARELGEVFSDEVLHDGSVRHLIEHIKGNRNEVLCNIPT